MIERDLSPGLRPRDRTIAVDGAAGTRSESTECKTTTAENDELVQQWLWGKSQNTREAYARDVERFLRFAGVKCLTDVSLDTFVRYAGDLERAGFAIPTINRHMAALRSLYRFLWQQGIIPRSPIQHTKHRRVKDDLAQRILTEEEVQRMFQAALYTEGRLPIDSWRNYVLVRVLYYTGARIAEVCGLRWADLQAFHGLPQITLFGKGEKTRAVRIPPVIFDELMQYRRETEAKPEEPIFNLVTRSACRIVRCIATAARIGRAVSPHWFRHAHASHSLDHGCPIHIVRQTLGHISLIATQRYLHCRADESSATFLPLAGAGECRHDPHGAAVLEGVGKSAALTASDV